MTSRRSDEVATPPTDLFFGLSPGWPTAGPTTEIEAEPTWSPAELSTRNCSSDGDDWAAFQPLGAGSPDGKTVGADASGVFVFAEVVRETGLDAGLAPFAALALASLICRRRNERL